MRVYEEGVKLGLGGGGLIFQIVERIGEEGLHVVLAEALFVDCGIEEEFWDGEGGVLALDLLDVQVEICHLWPIILYYKVK